MLLGEFFFRCFECVAVSNLDVSANLLSLVGFAGVPCHCKSIMSTRIIVDPMTWTEQPDEAACTGELVLHPHNFGSSSTLLNADHHKVYYQGMPHFNGKVISPSSNSFIKECHLLLTWLVPPNLSVLMILTFSNANSDICFHVIHSNWDVMEIFSKDFMEGSTKPMDGPTIQWTSAASRFETLDLFSFPFF